MNPVLSPLIAVIIPLLVASLCRTGRAATVDVFPGPGTPFQDAINAASDGDTLRVHDGLYAEPVTITKPLKLQMEAAATIQAGCAVPVALDIAADNVKFKGRYGPNIGGGTVAAVRIRDSSNIVIKSGGFHTTCGSGTGLIISQSTEIKLSRLSISGVDCGAHITGIPLGGKVKWIGGEINSISAGPSAVGFLVDDVAVGAPVGHGGVSVKKVEWNTAHGDWATGLALHNADGLNVVRNIVVGTRGIEIDSTSDNNRFTNNQVIGTAGSALIDYGAGNCGTGNAFVPSGTLATCH